MATDASLPKEVGAPKQPQIFTAAKTRDPRIKQVLEQMRPPPTMSGYHAVRSRKQKMLRLVHQRSYTQWCGRVLGGDDADTRQAWLELVKSDQMRAIVAEAILLYELDQATEAERRFVEGLAEKLLDPFAEPLGICLLRAVAKELHTHTSTEGLPTCWAW